MHAEHDDNAAAASRHAQQRFSDRRGAGGAARLPTRWRWPGRERARDERRRWTLAWIGGP
eukprot:6142606-Prymnesium_polylepis.1